MPSSSYTGLYSEPLSGSGGGIGPEIVQTLRSYNKELPLAFLAHILGRSTADLEVDIRRLETRAVVQRVGDKVRLAA